MINQSSSFIKGHCWCKFQLYTIFRFEILKEFSLRKINSYWSWNFRKKQVNNGWIRSNSSDNWDVWEKNGFMYQLYVFVFACCCFVVAVVEVVVGLWMLWHSPSAFRLSYHKYWTLKNNSWSLLLIPPFPPEKPFIAREPPK